MGMFSVSPEEFSAAIDALDALQSTPEDEAAQSKCIAEIAPTVTQLRAGALLEPQLHKLIHAGNPQRAIKLLKAAGPGKRFLGIF